MDQLNLANSPKTIQDDRYYFASYLNMARHNVFLTICSICEKMGETPINNDDEIFTNKLFAPLQSNSKPDKVLRIIELLQRNFPFLEELENKYLHFTYPKMGKQKADPQDYYDMFHLLFNCLKDLRNEFTHAGEPKTIVPPVLINSLKGIFDAGVRRTKDRMGYSEDEISHLRRLKPEGRGTSKRTIEDPAFMYKFEESGNFTEKGHAFFICLFLEAQYSNKFLKQLKGFKDSRTRKSQATLEAFREYSMRIPKLRIESTGQDSLLFMDILNELARCPADLYEQLSKADKEKFKINPIDEDAAFSEENPVEIVLKRHEDRFTYFAMRYLDEQKAFPTLRFMVDLGNYHFKVYDKEIAGEPRLRRLTQKLTTFGRIQDYSLLQIKEKYGDLVKNSVEAGEDYPLPRIVETHPHYHFFDDNIALKMVDADADPLFPDIAQNLHPKSGAPDKKAMRPDLYLSRDEVMSMVLYAVLTPNSSFSPTEKIIKQHITRVKKCFTAIKEGTLLPIASEQLPNYNSTYAHSGKNSDWETTLEDRKKQLQEHLYKNFNELEINHLPEDLRNYLLGIQYIDPNIIAKARLEKMITQTEGRIRRIERETDPKERKNKVGSKQHREIKAGVLGDFIAKDLMRFQPPSDLHDPNKVGKGKPTGLTFQVLQAAIALYGLKKEELGDLFRECNLIDAPNAHPFIHQLNYRACKGIVDFYQQYLKARKKYLEKCLTEQKYEAYFWLGNNKQRAKAASNYARELAGRYLQLPVNMPRGLFLEPIKQALLQHANEDFTTLVQQAERTNTVFLLQKYYEKHLSDAPQPFYNFARTYKVYNQYNARHNGAFAAVKEMGYTTQEFIQKKAEVEKWIKTLSTQDRNGVNQQAAKRTALADMEKTEKKIRHQKAQDMVLFLMVKSLIQSAGDRNLWQKNLGQVKLKDITPNAEKGILSTPIPFQLAQSYVEEIDHSAVPNGRIITKTIHQDALKIKNYGDFRRFVKDRRLNNLMFYYEADTIDRSTIEKELERYDEARIIVFKAVLAFEQALINKWPEASSYIGDGTEKSKHGRMLDFLFDQLPQFKNMKGYMKNLRNTFSHNQYPEIYYFRKSTAQHDGNIATIFANFAENTYGKIANTLKNIQ